MRLKKAKNRCLKSGLTIIVSVRSHETKSIFTEWLNKGWTYSNAVCTTQITSVKHLWPAVTETKSHVLRPLKINCFETSYYEHGLTQTTSRRTSRRSMTTAVVQWRRLRRVTCVCVQFSDGTRRTAQSCPMSRTRERK